jgi:3-oxoacyl-[acyl-carrier protein] reductase
VLGPEKMQEISQNIPMGRMAEPEEISKAVLFVASELNSYISGQNIIVDGGFVNV